MSKANIGKLASLAGAFALSLSIGAAHADSIVVTPGQAAGYIYVPKVSQAGSGAVVSVRANVSAGQPCAIGVDFMGIDAAKTKLYVCDNGLWRYIFS